MKTNYLVIGTALALGALLAGCDMGPDRDGDRASRGASRGEQARPGAVPPQPQVNTPTTPANMGRPSTQEKKDGSNPVQGQVDPKEGAQHKDFQQRGDSAGPTSPEAKPRGG
jgi:hypothetical protein